MRTTSGPSWGRISQVARVRLRMVLFAIAAAAFLGTVAELVLAKHFKEPVQLIPFALSGVGLIADMSAEHYFEAPYKLGVEISEEIKADPELKNSKVVHPSGPATCGP